jgi:transposase-like protein
MKRKIRPSEEKNKRINEILSSETAEVMQEFFKAAIEKVYQECLELEANDFLGRDWYQRQNRSSKATNVDSISGASGYRNGYSPKRIKSREGILHVKRPRIRNSRETFKSKLLSRLDSMEERLNKMALEMYVRGLSTRDIEAALTDTDGTAILSRSSISQLNKVLYEEYEAFKKQDLSQFDVVYLFVDGVYEAVRRYTDNQTILCAWGILSDGRKMMFDLAAVASESEEAWTQFFEEMQTRGLRQPLMITSDGAKGLTKAISRSFPHSDRQRCIVHKLRNIMSKVPNEHHDEILAAVKAVYYAPDRETADILSTNFINKYSEQFPSMVRCFCDDLEACLAHLRYPQCHRKYIRTTNLIERSFEEEKRRTKVFPQHQHEKSALGLVFGVLIRSSHNWQRVKMSDLELAHLRNIRKIIYPKDLNNTMISFGTVA